MWPLQAGRSREESREDSASRNSCLRQLAEGKMMISVRPSTVHLCNLQQVALADSSCEAHLVVIGARV